MSIFKDFREEANGFNYRKQVLLALAPKEWFRLHKWRKQRADRGWSNRDTWGAGEHIAKITAEMLQHLNDNTYVDWPEWFRLNVKEEGKGAYKNLQSVIDDINNYLVHTETSWADDLTCDTSKFDDKYIQHWTYIATGKTATDADITHRINKWSAEEKRLYKKANKAMGFFGRHFASFWD